MSGLAPLGGHVPANVPSDTELDAGTPAAPAEAPPSTPAPAATPATSRSGASRLVDRALSEAEKAISKELLKPHEVDETFKLADGLAGGVRVKEQVWLPTAPEVAKDPLKKATSDALAAEGKTIAWGKTEGEVKLTSSFETKLGEGTIGFPAQAKLGYTLTRPYAYKEDGRTQPLETAKAALLAQTVGLPTSAKNARNLPPGAEFQLRGDLAYGATAASGGLSVGTKTAGFAIIDVKRLEGDKVEVAVTRESEDSTQAGLSRPLGGGATGTLGRTTVDGEKTVERFTLDLSNPRAQATYGALMRGDASAAKAVAASGAGSGVTVGARTVEEWDGRKLAAGLALSLTNGFGAGLNVYGEKISERDPRLTQSPMRQRMLGEAKAAGKDLEFHGTGGALEMSLGASGQWGAVGAGFSTKGLIEYHAVAPGGGLAPTALPLDAEKAKRLAAGTEVTLHGAGSAAVSAKAGWGVSTTAGPVTAGASVGVTSELRASKDLGLHITKLEGDKVRVVIADRDTKSGTVGVSAEAGISAIDREKIPGGSALEGIVGDKLADGAKKAVAKELQKYVSARASLGTTAETSSREVASYDLDLGTASGRAAYDKLLKLDARDAERLSQDSTSGVKKNGALDETVSTTRTEAKAEVFGQTIAMSKAERRDRLATLVNGGETTRISESEYTRSRKGLLKKGDIEWEAVHVKNETTGASERFLHLELKSLEDRWTSHGEWQRSERFAAMMGANVVEREVKTENPSWFGRTFNPSVHGKTTASADLYFTDAAMKKLAAASDEQALSAFALSTVKLEGEREMPGWAAGTPAMKAQAREILERYDPFDRDRDSQDLHAAYFRLTKRNIGEDHASYEDAKDFREFVQRSRGARDETERLKAFADLGQERRFDFHATIGAMNELSGDEVVLLNRFEVRGGDAKLVTSSEGGLKHPDTRVTEAFTPR